MGILTTMTKNIIRLFFLSLLTSCNNVDFDAPLPSDQTSLDKFDQGFIGKYYYMDSIVGKQGEEQFFNYKYFQSSIDKQDSITLFSADLVVTNKLVHYSFAFTAFYKLDKVDTSRLNKQFKYKDVFTKDNYFIHTENFSDTLLDLNKEDKLFLYNNRYYLNHFKKGDKNQSKDQSWGISQFEKLNLGIFSLNMTNDQDYKVLFDTNRTSQPIFPVAHLSNKQFKNFVDKGGFRQKYKVIKYTH